MRINEDFLDAMDNQEAHQLLGDEVTVEEESLKDYYPVEFTIKIPKDKDAGFYIKNIIKIHKVIDRMLESVSLITSHKKVQRILISFGHVPSE